MKIVQNSVMSAIAVGLILPSTVVAQAPPPAAPPAATFITLGTAGGPLPRARRAESANALVVGSDIYLFDAGDGVLRQMAQAGLTVARIKAVFISHHHIDHDGGVPVLLVNRWLFNVTDPLPVLGPPGTVAMVNGLPDVFAATMQASLSLGRPPDVSLMGSVAPQDLAPMMDRSTLVFQDSHVRVFAITNDHYHFPPGNSAGAEARSYAFRIEAGGRTIVYSGDTGASTRLQTLAKGADMLVSEVIDMGATRDALVAAHIQPPALDGIMGHMAHDHSPPEVVARLAEAAGVKDLVLTHLVPGSDNEGDTSGYTKGIAEIFKGRVRVANDLDRF